MYFFGGTSLDGNIEIGLIDFFRDDEWSEFYKSNHRDKVLSKGHSEFRGNMKDRTMRLLSTYYHEPLKLIGKKDEKKLIIGKNVRSNYQTLTMQVVN